MILVIITHLTYNVVLFFKNNNKETVVTHYFSTFVLFCWKTIYSYNIISSNVKHNIHERILTQTIIITVFFKSWSVLVFF